MIDLVLFHLLFYFYFSFYFYFFISNLNNRVLYPQTINRQVLLLSLLSSSYIVVLERDLVNTLFSYFSNSQSNQPESFTTQQMDIEINMFRGQSISSDSNIFRKSSAHSNTFSIVCADRIQVLANNPT